MADEVIRQDEDVPTGDDAANQGQDAESATDVQFLQNEVAKWKAHSRKHEGQAKANAAAAKRLEEIENANKTEAEKLAEEKAASDKVAASAQGELMRLRVAMRLGLTEAQAKRLVGETEEELEADAEELLASFGHKDGADNGAKPSRPKERLRSGAVPDEEPDETDPRKLAAAVPRL